MPYYKFGTNDIFYNTIEAHPKCKFLIYNGKTYYNEQIPDPATNPNGNNPYDANVDHVKTGDISLYEMNVNRDESYTIDQTSRSIAFDGVDAYIKIDIAQKADSSDYELDFGTGSFTISAWVKTTDTTADIFTSSATGNVKIRISDGHLQAVLSNRTTTNTGSNKLNDGAWHHIVVVRDDRQTLYVDGEKKISDPSSGDIIFGDSAYIGTDALQGSFFTGSIDDIAVWNEALSADAIRDIYNGVPANLKQTFGSYDKSDKLVGWWTMGDGIVNHELLLPFTGDEGSTTITDTGANGITCTAEGNAAISTQDGDTTNHPTVLLLTGGHVKVAYNKSLDFGLEDFTIEFWIKFTSNNSSGFVDDQGATQDAINSQYAIFSQKTTNTYHENTQGFFGLRYDFDFGETEKGHWIIESAKPTGDFIDLYYIEDDDINTTNWFKVKIERSTMDGVTTQRFYRQAAGFDDLVDETTEHIYPVNLDGRDFIIGDWKGEDNGSLAGSMDGFEISRANGITASVFPRILDHSGKANHGWMIDMSPDDISVHSEPSMIYPFINKSGTALSFKSVGESEFQSFQYGDLIAGKYPLSAGISIEQFPGLDNLEAIKHRSHIVALQNTLNHYKTLSPYFSYDGDNGKKYNIKEDPLVLVSIPSIFYGSSIEKGSVNLKYYYNGELKGELQDSKKNGELIQTTSLSSGDNGGVAGIVLYNEGFIILFSATAYPDFDSIDQHWYTDWGTIDSDDTLATSTISFNGTNRIPTLTMLAHARKGELNHSNNPTYLTFDDKDDNMLVDSTGGTVYAELENLEIANTTKSPHTEAEASFQKQVWISKIGIYDENKNLIAIAKLANPVRKTEDRDFTFKLKLDF